MEALKKYQQWRETRTGLITWAVIDLGLAYWAASRAIDTGRIFYYFLTIGLTVIAVTYVVRAIKLHGKK